MTKRRLTFDEQLDLLRQRGLAIEDEPDCRAFLSRTNYYRFSGYLRYFQVDPGAGDDRFHSTSTFHQVRALYEADAELRRICYDGLQRAEVALRTAFAYHFSGRVGVYGHLTAPATYLGAGANQSPVHEAVLRDLDRSRERHITHFALIDPSTGQRTYRNLPVWSAVEALSFGTLSKCVEYCAAPEVAKDVAQDLGVAWTGFTSQIRSFTYLRNRVAHHGRLWHHSVIDAPMVPNNVTNRAKRGFGQFSNRSIYLVLVALDSFLKRAGLLDDYLGQVNDQLSTDEIYRRGIVDP